MFSHIKELLQPFVFVDASDQNKRNLQGKVSNWKKVILDEGETASRILIAQILVTMKILYGQQEFVLMQPKFSFNELVTVLINFSRDDQKTFLIATQTHATKKH